MDNLKELDERKEKILKLIIKTYLDTGEPVGSRTISKMINEELSSATIRNEMSDLEDMGYIMQPHASAGRVPSDKGYRFYVDSLMIEKSLEVKQIKTEMFERVDRLENMLKGLVKTIATNTNYAAMISAPSVMGNKIKYIQLSTIEENKILAVIVLEGNIVKTHIIDIGKTVSSKDIVDLSVSINEKVSGREVREIIEKKFFEEIKNNDIKKIIQEIVKAIKEDPLENSIFTSGANNFLKYKELTENENVENLVETFEHKNELVQLIDNVNKENGIKIYIGDETPIESMKDCSVVTANCDFGNGMKGMVGVVGPKRMDYEKVIKAITGIVKNVGRELEE